MSVLANLVNDIPRELANRAHAGTSFVPEQRGEQEVATYAATLEGDFKNLSSLCGTPEKFYQLETEFARYREGYRRRYIVMLGAKSACVSTMIAGGSNFNMRRAQKRGASADKRTQDLIDFRQLALTAMRKKLTPEAQPIAQGDSDALERLGAKIAKLERLQEQMKLCNATIRKYAKQGEDAQVAALVALGLFGENRARELLQPDFAGRVGFADFEIKNNNANIRRLKDRLKVVANAKAQPCESLEAQDGTKIDIDPADNRIRVFFAGVPSADVRAKMKARGFRWAPSMGCWSAYCSAQAKALAVELCGVTVTP